MATTTKMITKATYILVTTDANGKETRQQMKKVDYEFRDFDRADFPTVLSTAAASLNN